MTADKKTAKTLASKRRWVRKNREHVNAHQRAYWRERSEQRKQLQRNYREAQLAKNPNYFQDRDKAFRAANPDYTREYYRRRKLRVAWLKFSTVCAAGRRALESYEHAITEAGDTAAPLETRPNAHADRRSASVPMRPSRRAYLGTQAGGLAGEI